MSCTAARAELYKRHPMSVLFPRYPVFPEPLEQRAQFHAKPGNIGLIIWNNPTGPGRVNYRAALLKNRGHDTHSPSAHPLTIHQPAALLLVRARILYSDRAGPLILSPSNRTASNGDGDRDKACGPDV
jgi:hypothetical protein